jgi:hypothetical protein
LLSKTYHKLDCAGEVNLTIRPIIGAARRANSLSNLLRHGRLPGRARALTGIADRGGPGAIEVAYGLPCGSTGQARRAARRGRAKGAGGRRRSVRADTWPLPAGLLTGVPWLDGPCPKGRLPGRARPPTGVAIGGGPPEYALARSGPSAAFPATRRAMRRR